MFAIPFMVGSTVLVGATIVHFALLALYKYFSNSRAKSTSFHGFKVLQDLDDDVYTEPSLYQQLEKSSENQTRSSTGARGLIIALPNRHTFSLKEPWSVKRQENVAHELITTCYEENLRSTYLGAETFDKSNPTAQLFGWNRVLGQPTVQLGEIAQVIRPKGEICLQVVLHPDDARKVVGAGWGIVFNSYRQWISSFGRKSGTIVILQAPQSQSEVEEITKVVLDAAVWYVAGLDREEQV